MIQTYSPSIDIRLIERSREQSRRGRETGQKLRRPPRGPSSSGRRTR